MKYQAYPEYKDSGVEWLGCIPNEWRLVRQKYLFSILSGYAFKSAHFQKESENFPALVTPGSFHQDGGLYFGEKNTHYYTGIFQPEYLLEKGDLLIVMTDLSYKKLILGNCEVVDKSNILLNQRIGKLIFSKKADMGINKKFLRYSINSKSVREQVILTSTGATVFHSSPEKIGNVFTLLPSIDEQQKIANFLDHETSKIDTLIEKQQQLIKLLKEKRQAVINHAVTKGLSSLKGSQCPMRDSGIEWLGEVPEHWEMVPLKYLCNFSGGGTPSKDNLSYWTGGNIPWVSPKDMKMFWLSETQDKLTEIAVDESSTNFVKPGALLMVVRSGILQRTIPIAINTVRVTLNQDMKALKFNKRMDTEYAANYILGNFYTLLLEWSKEGATVESIEQEYLSGHLMPVPPINEQLAINEHVKKRMTVFKSLEEHATKGINLLQERRTALISAAVTGKIDVRSWQAPVDSRLGKLLLRCSTSCIHAVVRGNDE